MSAYYLMKICRKHPESAAGLSSSWFYADRVSRKDTAPQRFSMSKVGVVKVGPPRGACWDVSSVFLSDSISDSPQIIFVSRKDAGSPLVGSFADHFRRPFPTRFVLFYSVGF